MSIFLVPAPIAAMVLLVVGVVLLWRRTPSLRGFLRGGSFRRERSWNAAAPADPALRDMEAVTFRRPGEVPVYREPGGKLLGFFSSRITGDFISANGVLLSRKRGFWMTRSTKHDLLAALKPESFRAVALFLLALLLPITARAGDYHHPKWARVEGCRDTRAVVIAAQCSAVTWRPRAGHPEGCTIAAAVCRDHYSGAEIVTDTASQALQVDHVLPAHVAWFRRETAERPWTAVEWARFGNDPLNLLVTRSRTNERKSDLMPGQWCPAASAELPFFAAKMRAVAAKYSIPLTAAELVALALWDRESCPAGSKVVP